MHRFNPDHYAKLDDPERMEWQDPHALLEYLVPEPGDVIVDIGSGTGFFAVPIAESEPEAEVIGADISPKMAEILARRAADKNIKNLASVVLEGKSLPFADGFADIVLMANVLHEFEDAGAMLEEVRRILKMGGRLVLIDWKMDITPVGPPMEERIGEGEAFAMVAEHDFEPAARIEIYPYHYVLVFV